MLNPCEEKVTVDEKLGWIIGVGRNTYIARQSKMNDRFLNTSCLLTAAVLRYRSTGELWWNVSFNALTQEFVDRTFIFQVGFGIDGDYDEHIITVCNGTIYQSCFGEWGWDVRKMVVPIAKEDKSITAQEIFDMTGCTIQDGDYDYLIFVP